MGFHGKFIFFRAGEYGPASSSLPTCAIDIRQMLNSVDYTSLVEDLVKVAHCDLGIRLLLSRFSRHSFDLGPNIVKLIPTQ